jgi:hypothetical protein
MLRLIKEDEEREKKKVESHKTAVNAQFVENSKLRVI